MKTAQIDERNICVSISGPSVSIPDEAPPNIVLVADDENVLGQRYDDGVWIDIPHEPEPDLVADVSRRQFFQALYKRELISKAEALAAISTGAIPAVMQSLIDQMPEETRDDAEFLIAGATMFERRNPVAEFIRVLFGWSVEQADDFWRFAATL